MILLSRQFLIYVAVGLLSAAVDLGSLQLMLVLGSSATLAVTIAFVLALICNYVFHMRVTFRSRHDNTTLLRFLVLVLLNYLLTLGCVWLGEWWVDSVMAGKLLSLPLVTLNGFLLGKYWIFKPAAAQ